MGQERSNRGFNMDQHIIDTVRALRAELHGLAERSGEETQTKARLMAFLRENTSLRLDDHGAWFCAVHTEPGAETIAFRADMDALPLSTDGIGNGAAHRCGHDGHSAILAGLGLLLADQTLGRNIVLIFQHAEETGQGGEVCAKALEQYQISRVYAFHNIPCWPEGAVLLRRGVFACASRGMTVTFTGTPTHAAYPEDGRNPGYAAARLIAALPELTGKDRYRGLAMATLIGADIGGKAFGTAAGSAEVRLTLRAWHEDDLKAMITAIRDRAAAEAAGDDVKTAFSFCDIFPATVNEPDALQRLESACRRAGLDSMDIAEPFRWSEDFGYYGRYAGAAMAGIGVGEEWPQLHTENYTFNDQIIPKALALFSELAKFG